MTDFTHNHHGMPAEPADAGQATAPVHDKHAGHTPEMFRDRLWVSLVLTIPIVYLSGHFQEWFRYRAVEFPGDDWVTPVAATVLFAYAGIVFLRGAVGEIRHRVPGMMVLISLAITVAFAYSLAVTFGLEGEPLYWELATLLDVMLLGHWLEMRSVAAASRALDHLAAMVPAVAHHLGADGVVHDMPVDMLRVGDRVLVRPGEQVPVDATVVEGASSVNEAFLTGESRPVDKTTGSEIVAGSVNGEGALIATVVRVGGDTTLRQIMRLVSEAQASRSRFQALADRAARALTVIAVVVAVPTVIAWLIWSERGVDFAIARAVTVLVIACPHALGLAIPLVTTSATAVAAQHGILVRNREAFERGRAIRRVAFDKTGTLTEGRFEVAGVTTAGMPEAQALGVAAALEQSSEHPLAAAIVAAAAAKGIALPEASAGTAAAGKGITGSVEGVAYRVGKPEWAEEIGIALSPELRSALGSAGERGDSAVLLFDDKTAHAVFSLRDRVRPSARRAIDRLRRDGIEPVMITGDAAAVAAAVAGELGIDRHHSRVLPGDKARLITTLAEEGPIGFVGDGINDGPALLAADLGMAIGAGTNVAIESADLVLVDDDPEDAVRALSLSRATGRKMSQNLLWATGYNVVALPLASGVLATAGLLLEPAVGALLMSSSTVIVALNAMLLRRIDLS